jgi:peptidoglycan/LPS O-acetylase OafA/YrhL
VRDYVRRRLLRIVPAYWFALTILALWPGLPGSPLGSDWWRYYGFDQDASDRTLFGGLGTAWSLGTEMSFYLVLPVYALLIARLTRGRSVRHRVRVDLGLLLVLSVGSLLARAAFAQTEPQLGYTLLGTFDWFAVGMAVALASALIEHTGHAPAVVRALRRRPSLCWGAAFAGLTFAAWYWERTGRYDPYTAGPLHLIWAAIAFFLVLPAAFPRRDRTGVPGRVLSFRLLVWVGLVSYGIYLWHLPLIPKVRDGLVAVTGHSLTGAAGTLELFACVVVLATACAAVSYYVVEQPVLRFKNGFPRRERLELPRLETEPG